MNYGYVKFGSAIWTVVIAISSLCSIDVRAQGRETPARGGSYCATRFMFCAGCDTFTTISVQTGKVCTINFYQASGTGAILGQKVVVRPRSGIYGTANETAGAYKPNDGFAGNDSFQVDIDYEMSGQRFVTHLKANVNVRP
jgi:hypothetical protein